MSLSVLQKTDCIHMRFLPSESDESWQILKQFSVSWLHDSVIPRASLTEHIPKTKQAIFTISFGNQTAVLPSLGLISAVTQLTQQVHVYHWQRKMFHIGGGANSLNTCIIIVKHGSVLRPPSKILVNF